MKVMKNFKKAILLFVAISTLVACKKFDEINVDPIRTTDVSEDLLFTRALRYGALDWDFYQIGQNLHADMFTQYFANSAPGFGTDRYISNAGWITSFWNTYYSNLVINTQEVIRKTVDDPAKSNKYNVARIWRAWLFHRATDYWGDIPYSQAGKGVDGLRTPKYDKQEDIYADLNKELKEASAALDLNKTVKFGGPDLVYSGDLTKWKKFANSLRLRIAMRMSKVDPAKAQSIVQEIMTQNELMTSNADNALMAMQPAGQFVNRNPLAILFGFDEFKVSKTMVDLLKSLNDPRLPIYATPIAGSNPAAYAGLQNGLNPTQLGEPANARANFSSNGVLIRAEGAPIDIMTFSELSFLKAEAVQRGWGTGNASTFYNDGVTSSISRRGAIAPTAISTYLAQSSVAYDGTLKQIATQKWLALFPNGFEGWAEWRRTGFPVLAAIPNNDGETGGTTPRRVIYPPTEATLNPESYKEAVARQGVDKMTTRMWWDKL